MNNIEIYHSKKESKYYFIGFATCNYCNNIIKYSVIIVRDSKTNIQNYYCISCNKKIKQPIGHQLMCLATVADELPDDALPIFNLAIEISVSVGKNGVVNVWEASTQSADQEKIIDNAIQSHNPNFMIQSDAKDPAKLLGDLQSEQALLEAKNNFEPIKLVSDDELDNLLNSYKDAQILISTDEQKKLGVKK